VSAASSRGSHCTAAGVEVVLYAHDEVLAEVDEDQADAVGGAAGAEPRFCLGASFSYGDLM
jgi:hypothetical protein